MDLDGSLGDLDLENLFSPWRFSLNNPRTSSFVHNLDQLLRNIVLTLREQLCLNFKTVLDPTRLADMACRRSDGTIGSCLGYWCPSTFAFSVMSATTMVRPTMEGSILPWRNILRTEFAEDHNILSGKLPEGTRFTERGVSASSDSIQIVGLSSSPSHNAAKALLAWVRSQLSSYGTSF